MDVSEDLVHLPIPTSPLPPILNDSLVVSEDPEIEAWLAGRTERASKKLKANGLSPSNVPAICLLAWDKAPSSPFTANNNADAKT
jgi:hypothetical protein